MCCSIYWSRTAACRISRSRWPFPVLCCIRHIRSLNEKTGTQSRIGLLQFYYEWIAGEQGRLPLKKARISRRETNVPPLSFEKNDVK